jgi:predicted unusual protein kinase regulating ubiquinone biosynthesis (AarF/ABC1/UbiB family)
MELINSMTDLHMQYKWSCIKPNVSYHYYYESLKKSWEKIINDFINSPYKCRTTLEQLFELYRYAKPERIAKAIQLKNKIEEGISLGKQIISWDDINIDDIALDVVATSLINMKKEQKFRLEQNFMKCLQSLSIILVENCECQLVDIFKFFAKKYSNKYSKKFLGKSKNDVVDMLRLDYQKFKETIRKISDEYKNKQLQFNIFEKLATRLAGLYSFSIESELGKMIPKELNSLKIFFTKIITKYYNDLHPIVWAQILKSMFESLFVELPYTNEEIFGFISKHLLLNSGPLILKILQMIRPFLDNRLAHKYNLVKLKYPLLTSEQVNLILRKCVLNWDMYKILGNYSASVGHVCKVCNVTNPSNVFIIKIIKPLAIAQSCWEYKTLYDIFPEGTCEQLFIKHMLESNGKELNVNNEKENIRQGFRYYTDTYENTIGIKIPIRLSTINNVDNVIVDGCWYALAMTLAPGISLSNLAENKLIENDTRYRAKLHRCLDILVYKFFSNLVTNGFYHGDLHSGNIFFSYEQNVMTLIDFGTTNNINNLIDDPNIKTFLEIIVMSIFFNFDEMLDVLTNLINSKCQYTQIDMKSDNYSIFRSKLTKHKIYNTLNYEVEIQNSDQYENDIFSSERIRNEGYENKKQESFFYDYHDYSNEQESIYKLLEYQPRQIETIVENRDVLPKFTNIVENKEFISFENVIENIIRFFALSGVNIAVKFNEFYEIQKAYSLLLGVLYRVHYHPYRIEIIIRKAVLRLSSLLKSITNPSIVWHVLKTYYNEKKKFNEFKNKVQTLKQNKYEDITQFGVPFYNGDNYMEQHNNLYHYSICNQ